MQLAGVLIVSSREPRKLAALALLSAYADLILDFAELLVQSNAPETPGFLGGTESANRRRSGDP
jgi:hypothetical protein